MAVNAGQFLRVNLSTGQQSIESIPEDVARDFIGGRGYGVKYLYDELAPNTDPLGEDNKLILLNGPLAGTATQAASRWMAITKSPLTGGFFRSVCGADFGAWLKFAGFDFIIIEGRAEKPVYLEVTEEGAKINDASAIWGKDSKEAQEWLTEQHGKNTRCACIGQAGEKLVRYAAIVSDRRTAGRGGTGAVMGSKNLKAVAVVASRKEHLADADTYHKLAREQVNIIKDNPGFLNHQEWGTMRTQEITNDLGVYPTKNFRWGRQDGNENITGAEYRKIRTGKIGCYSCPARCGMAHTVPDRPYKGAHSEGPEYESVWAFTGPIDSTDIPASIAADQLCDDMGLDTISAGSAIGFAFELYEKGIITQADTDGLELTYGNHAAMVALIKKIALREGFGDILAEGTARAAASIGKGSEHYAIHVKGLELPAYEPRGAKTMGFNYATASIGASHCYGYGAQDIFGAPVPRPSDRFAEEENADLVVFNQDGAAWHEVGISCTFSSGWGWVDSHFGALLAASRGMEILADADHLLKTGKRIITMERAFNVREGKGRKDDTLPQRMLTEPLHTSGAPGEGEIVRRQDQFLDKYYELRGWDKNGVPTAEELENLGIGYVAKDMAGK